MTSEIEQFENQINIEDITEFANKLKSEVSKVLVGQEDMVELIIAAMLANGHVLIEGVPGMAKTMTTRLISDALEAKFSRIQFTPDLMPSDVTGNTVFNPQSRIFEFVHGPIFGNLVLIDEINRAPAKTQSALFEVMEERQVTVSGSTYRMSEPFMVIATQNPVEHEGTYRLPEAQIDRFMFKITIDYPDSSQELEILNRTFIGKTMYGSIKPIFKMEKIVEFRKMLAQVNTEESVKKYIIELSRKTRNNHAIYLGVSPRASQQLMLASQALAVLSNRDFVTPDDVKKAIYPCFRHRIILSPEKEMEGSTADDIILDILNSVEVPR